jgi:ATP-binding cassette subfamily B protein
VADRAADVTPRERLGGYRNHARMLWSVAPGATSGCLATTLVISGCAIVNTIAVGRLVGSLAGVLLRHDATGRLWTWFGLFACATIVSQIAAFARSWSSARVNAAYRIRVEELVAEVGLAPRDLGHLENEEFGGALTTLTDNSRHWLFRAGLGGTWDLLGSKITALGSTVIVLSWRWWVPFVLIAAYGTVSRLTLRWIDKLLDGLFAKPRDDLKRANYISRLMIHPEAAKEIRLFGIADWLEDRYSLLWRAFQTTFWREAHSKMIRLLAACLIEIVAVCGAFALLAYDAYHGRVSANTITTYLIAILALRAFGLQGDSQSGLIRVGVFLRRLIALRSQVGLPAMTIADAPPIVGQTAGAAAIDIRDVTFTYPSRDEPTLQDLSLRVPAGQSLAIVGVNGAGKSTLMKLLAGLYRPDTGTIRVRDRDPFSDENAHGDVAVVFQDFMHYPLSLRDNVGFGAMGKENDQLLLDKAMRDAAGGEVLDRLDGDWEAVLSKEFEGGTDLSGGQWQRIALARALASVGGGSGVLVLDEPTAALDSETEHALFERYAEAAHNARGRITILVSHRFSTVRMADLIVVLDGSRLVEVGSHEQLMARRGQYSELYEIQAAAYR